MQSADISSTRASLPRALCNHCAPLLEPGKSLFSDLTRAVVDLGLKVICKICARVAAAPALPQCAFGIEDSTDRALVQRRITPQRQGACARGWVGAHACSQPTMTRWLPRLVN